MEVWAVWIVAQYEAGVAATVQATYGACTVLSTRLVQSMSFTIYSFALSSEAQCLGVAALCNSKPVPTTPPIEPNSMRPHAKLPQHASAKGSPNGMVQL